MINEFKYCILLLIFTSILGCNYLTLNDESLLKNYDLNGADNKVIYLPNVLKEASGIAYLDESHILTHNDEKGLVYKINITSGKVIAEFSIGKKEIEKDFEGIALVDDSVYLVSSNGTLFKFSLFNGKDNIEYEKITTPLSSKNNVEGLCYYENTNSLLLACKSNPGKNYISYKAVYEFDLTHMKFIDKPKFLISLAELKKKFDIKDFRPSGIEINPKNGNIFLISANPEAIVEIDSTGELLNAQELNDKKHKQPEGITFLKDGTLILADESNGKKAKITIIAYND
jgi:uncharacterized protein YjiK